MSKGLMLLFGGAVVYMLFSAVLGATGWKRLAMLAVTTCASALLLSLGYCLFAAP